MTEMTISRSTDADSQESASVAGFTPLDHQNGGETPNRRKKKKAGMLKTSRAKRIVGALLLVLLPLVTIFGAMSPAHAEDDTDPMKLSFYKVSSAMTSFFSVAQGPDAESADSLGANATWAGISHNPGTAGGFLGYGDSKMHDNSGWLSSMLSGSSSAIGYATLTLTDGNNNRLSTDQQGLLGYAYYGAALSGLGLDDTSTGLSTGAMSMIGGAVVMLLYLMAGVVDWLFETLLDVLTWLNPFKLFYAGVNAISPQFANGMTGGEGPPGFLGGLSNQIGDWYKVLNSMAWTVMVPVFLAVLIMSMLLMKKMDKGSAIKRFVVRLLFIGLGLPLLGSMYTGVLTSMNAATDSGNSGSTRVIMSTFIDFQNWSLKGRLALPSGASVAWNPNISAPTGESESNVRNTTLAINNQTHSLRMNSLITNGDKTGNFSDAAMGAGEDEFGFGSSVYVTTMDMLWRHMNGAQVTASAFETDAKGNLIGRNIDGISSWFGESGEDKLKFNSDKDLEKMPVERINSNPVIALAGGSGLRASGDGAAYKFSTSQDLCVTALGSHITLDGSPRTCNLSPLAMYNYLNTDFGSSSMTMYSSSNAASEATRSIHNSVNLVGTGPMSFLYWVNAVTLLGSFVIIGIGYAFSLLFANIKRTFQMATAIPFATLGAIAGIAKVIVYSVALIAEVLVTIFVYKFVQEFLVSLPQIIEMPFAKLLNASSGGPMRGFMEFLMMGSGFVTVITLLSIIGVVLFTIMAMRLRKSLVKSIEEASTKIIEKFLDTSIGSPGGSGGGMMPALAGGLAAGAGTAAASRMMGGGSSSSSDKGSKMGGGPDEVSSAPDGPDLLGGGGGGDDGPPPPPPGGGGELPPGEGGGGSLEGGGSDDPSGNHTGGALTMGSTNNSNVTQSSVDTEMGRDVERNGLSMDGRGGSGVTDSAGGAVVVPGSGGGSTTGKKPSSTTPGQGGKGSGNGNNGAPNSVPNGTTSQLNGGPAADVKGANAKAPGAQTDASGNPIKAPAAKTDGNGAPRTNASNSGLGANADTASPVNPNVGPDATPNSTAANVGPKAGPNAGPNTTAPNGAPRPNPTALQADGSPTPVPAPNGAAAVVVPPVGGPTNGKPKPTTKPANATPTTGKPQAGQGAPKAGAPVNGQPQTGTPAKGQPVTGAQNTGAPQSGAPTAGALSQAGTPAQPVQPPTGGARPQSGAPANAPAGSTSGSVIVPPVTGGNDGAPKGKGPRHAGAPAGTPAVPNRAPSTTPQSGGAAIVPPVAGNAGAPTAGAPAKQGTPSVNAGQGGTPVKAGTPSGNAGTPAAPAKAPRSAGQSGGGNVPGAGTPNTGVNGVPVAGSKNGAPAGAQTGNAPVATPGSTPRQGNQGNGAPAARPKSGSLAGTPVGSNPVAAPGGTPRQGNQGNGAGNNLPGARTGTPAAPRTGGTPAAPAQAPSARQGRAAAAQAARGTGGNVSAGANPMPAPGTSVPAATPGARTQGGTPVVNSRRNAGSPAQAPGASVPTARAGGAAAQAARGAGGNVSAGSNPMPTPGANPVAPAAPRSTGGSRRANAPATGNGTPQRSASPAPIARNVGNNGGTSGNVAPGANPMRTPGTQVPAAPSQAPRTGGGNSGNTRGSKAPTAAPVTTPAPAGRMGRNTAPAPNGPQNSGTQGMARPKIQKVQAPVAPSGPGHFSGSAPAATPLARPVIVQQTEAPSVRGKRRSALGTPGVPSEAATRNLTDRVVKLARSEQARSKARRDEEDSDD